MTKTYKSKDTWAIAVKKENYYCITTTEDDPLSWRYIIPTRFVEDHLDVREEVVETKDWISKCVDKIFEYQRWRPWDEPDYVSVRKIIEKHCPTSKKFTRDDVYKFRDSFSWTFMLYDFLKLHWLLEE
jgi:hypothetical protein